MNVSGGIRIVVAGGGTGGHLYPGIAIVERLCAQDGNTEVLFIGARGGMEEKILPQTGWKASFIAVKGLRRATLLTKLATPFTLVAAVVSAMGMIRQFRADIVLGTGGYASAASVIAAVLLRVPRVLQEQNSIPGLVNRRMARFADLILLSYESSLRWVKTSARTAVVGNPLRDMPVANRGEASQTLGLSPDVATVLVIGGSRGARALSHAAVAASAILPSVQFLILCGANDGDALRSQVTDSSRVKVVDYLDDVWNAYAVADIAVARAGASTVFELAAYGVPTIFVPYPYAADDHQDHNIAPLVERGAALRIGAEILSADTLADALVGLVADESVRSDMSAKMRSWARPDAASRAADAIVELAKKKVLRAPPETVPITIR